MDEVELYSGSEETGIVSSNSSSVNNPLDENSHQNSREENSDFETNTNTLTGKSFEKSKETSIDVKCDEAKYVFMEESSTKLEDIVTEPPNDKNMDCAMLKDLNDNLREKNNEQKKIIEMLRIEVTRKDEELLAAESNQKSTEKMYNNYYSETTKKFNDLKKAFDLANKDKESMVIKYAMGEKDIIIARKGKEDLEKKMKEVLKDKESLQYKIKTLGTERTRLQGICDTRAQETISARKEVDKWKEEIKALESKMNLTSSRLKAEVDAHRETRESLDTTFKQLVEVQGTIDDIRAECNEAINKVKIDEENLKKKEIIQEKEQSVKLMIDSAAAAELDTLKKKHQALLNENNDLSITVQDNKKELLKYELNLSELKETVGKQKVEIVDLYSRCAELESIKLQLNKESEKVSSRDCEVARLRAENAEILADMVNCRRKECELLEYTQKLTDKNVCLQSEFTSIESKATSLEESYNQVVNNLARTESEMQELLVNLNEEKRQRKEETELLAKKLAEKVRSVTVADQQVIDAKNDLEVFKRQNVLRVKELTKELNASKKKIDSFEKCARESSPGLSISSRCSSSSSLHKEIERGDISPAKKSSSTANLGSPSSNEINRKLSQSSIPEVGQTNRAKDCDPPVSNNNVSTLLLPEAQHLLVEKIIKLQRSCAKRQEKLDLLEEHVEQLTNEIKKKNRLIQNYFLNMEPGALVSEESDTHKVYAGSNYGIMASLYNSKVNDTSMTLELSLEINKKLQAVLEDTLLKNITLKENMNTLGQEISRISLVNHKSGQ